MDDEADRDEGRGSSARAIPGARWRRTFTANTELVTDEEGRER